VPSNKISTTEVPEDPASSFFRYCHFSSEGGGVMFRQNVNVTVLFQESKSIKINYRVNLKILSHILVRRRNVSKLSLPSTK
jgi:hypothetical protein